MCENTSKRIPTSPLGALVAVVAKALGWQRWRKEGSIWFCVHMRVVGMCNFPWWERWSSKNVVRRRVCVVWIPVPFSDYTREGTYCFTYVGKLPFDLGRGSQHWACPWVLSLVVDNGCLTWSFVHWVRSKHASAASRRSPDTSRIEPRCHWGLMSFIHWVRSKHASAASRRSQDTSRIESTWHQ